MASEVKIDKIQQIIRKVSQMGTRLLIWVICVLLWVNCMTGWNRVKYKRVGLMRGVSNYFAALLSLKKNVNAKRKQSNDHGTESPVCWLYQLFKAFEY